MRTNVGTKIRRSCAKNKFPICCLPAHYVPSRLAISMQTPTEKEKNRLEQRARLTKLQTGFGGTDKRAEPKRATRPEARSPFITSTGDSTSAYNHMVVLITSYSRLESGWDGDGVGESFGLGASPPLPSNPRFFHSSLSIKPLHKNSALE